MLIDSEGKAGDRDVFNERPTREEQSTAVQVVEKPRATATTATIHTNKGDIFLKLFPDIAPKTVENFVTHIKGGYYNRIIFHRVIRKFVSIFILTLLVCPSAPSSTPRLP